MSISGDFPGSFLDGLLRASWQAAALVVIVVPLQRLLRPWLAARWRHALWLVVLARLLLPVTPASGWSVFNLAPVGRTNPAIQAGVRSTTVPSAPGHKATVSRPAGFEPTQRSRAPGDPGSPFDLESVPPIATVLPAGGPPTASVDLPEPVVAAGNGLPMGEVSPAPGLTVVVQWPVWFGGGLWLTGFVLVAGRVIFGSVRFGRTLSACRPLARPAMAAALDDCRRRLGVRREVAVFESEAVRSPALCGLWRPCLLWPPGLADTLRAEELRHVLLHELAHLKRRDILVNWIAALAQAIHWFNPAVWYAGRRLRADRELAADALVLAALGEPQARAYGETILKLLRGWSGPAAIPAMAGILEGKPAVRERIRAIAVYRAPGRWSALAGWLVAGLGLVTLTDAQPRNAAGPVAAEATRAVAPVPTADDDAPFRPLNLARHYVTHWDAIKPGTSWDAAPKGRQTFDGVPFEVGGLLELSGMGVLRENKRFPSRVEGIPVGGRVGGLHLLHGAAYDATDGTPIGRLVLHYADGETRDLPIRYGIHSRNWWVESSELSGAIGDPATRVAWTGRSPESDARDATLRLFQTRFVNPRPDQPVTSLDVVSLLVRASPVILALTVESSGADTGTPVADVAPTLDNEGRAGECRLLIVAADTGRPLAGATACVQVGATARRQYGVYESSPTHTLGEQWANAQGRVTVDFPREGFTKLTLLVRARGYVARRETRWANPLPPELTIQLEPGIRIGGVVSDPRGRPVAGARVRVNGGARDSSGQIIDDELETVETDASGKWVCRSVPPNPRGLNFTVTHPEFLPTEYDQATSAGPEGILDTRSLLAGEAAMTLEPGFEVIGAVVTAAGEKVADAELLLATGAKLATRRQARTDAEGRFRFVSLETGDAAVVAQASGLAPQLRKIRIERGLAPLTFPLVPARTIKGRVLDDQDQPAVGAEVTVPRWQDLDLLKWRTMTDADGGFTWDSAPGEAVTLAVSKPGFEPTTREINPKEGPELTLRLTKEFLFIGRVIEADTGRPIASFRLMPGIVWNGADEASTAWQPEPARTFVGLNGTFRVALDRRPGGQVRLMALADGYLPEMSPRLATSGWHEHEFRLKKGEGPRGVVVNAAGQPVRDAEVGVLGYGSLTLVEGAFGEGNGPDSMNLAKTDGEGRFALPAFLPNPRLVVVHREYGFAEVQANDLASTGKIALLPWGRVEGLLKIGSEVAPNSRVGLFNRGRLENLSFDSDAFGRTTDAEGRFAFTRVPPGECMVARHVQYRRTRTFGHEQRLTVQPGEVVRVALGGTGRPVVGKVVLRDPKRKVDWANGLHMLSTLFPEPPADQRTPEGIRDWQTRPELKEAIANQRRYGLGWKEDGSFRIDDVPAGRYRLDLNFADLDAANPMVSVGEIHREVEVPEMSGGRSDEPLDLGELSLTLRSEAEIHAPLPLSLLPPL